MLSSVVVISLLAAFILLAMGKVDGMLVNVALNKTCQLSSSADDDLQTCSRAVNGNTAGKYIGTDNCIHTKVGDTEPSFQVDLGRAYPIAAIIILARNTYESRMANFVVTVDEEQCYHFPAETSSFHREIRLNCSSPLNGRVVRISKVARRQPDGEDTLNLCELQVLSCASEAWGGGCDQQCGHCRGREGCDKVTGHCQHCEHGYQLPFCVQPVSPQDDSSAGYHTATAAYSVVGALAAIVSITTFT